jgi:hypothetical protein
MVFGFSSSKEKERVLHPFSSQLTRRTVALYISEAARHALTPHFRIAVLQREIVGDHVARNSHITVRRSAGNSNVETLSPLIGMTWSME